MASEFRAELERFVANASKPTLADERGIVTCAGGVRLFTSAYVLIRVLRETLGCDLPVQLWHFGGSEITPAMRHILHQYDVELVDVTSVPEFDGSKVADGWQLKAFAIYHSRFSEVLFLDADQVPTKDPSFLFDSPQYRETGAVFWPDIVDLSADNPIWELLQLPPAEVVSWESGQILVNKKRHWQTLIACIFLGAQAETVYRMIYGDKDTFQMAWRVLGHPVTLVQHRPFTDERVLVQRDFDGAPLFQHRTSAKWTYDAPQHDFEGSVHHETCLGFLAQLKDQWNGRAFFPPDRSQSARTEEYRLSNLGELELEIVGNHSIFIDLRDAHEIGRGRSVERQNWFVHDVDEDLELVIIHGDSATIRARKTANGLWEGEFLKMDGGRVVIQEPAPSSPLVTSLRKSLVDDLIEASGLDRLASLGESKAIEDLQAALKLHARMEPAVRQTLEAYEPASDSLKMVIKRVLIAVEADLDRNPNKDGGVLEEGYVRPNLSKL